MPEQNNMNGQGEAQRFAEAVAIANIPTLLMVLVQLTGDLHWLEEPYRPRRARGMGDNDTGGLPEPIQAGVRQAALEAIVAWRAGRPVAIPAPSSDLRLKMLSWTMDEKVPAEYDPIIAAELLLEENDVIEKLPVPGDGYVRRRWRRSGGSPLLAQKYCSN
jgi:4-hydroxyacetophenone monooxygenase